MSSVPIKDGGQAFPVPGLSQLPNGDFMHPSFGMTLRDYFAAKAVQGLCANPGGPFQANDRSGWGLVNCSLAQIAEEAYYMADAMLHAREINHG